jgi:hypothetical protein
MDQFATTTRTRFGACEENGKDFGIAHLGELFERVSRSGVYEDYAKLGSQDASPHVSGSDR